MQFSVDNKTLQGMRQAHLGQMSDDAATEFMEKFSQLWEGTPNHGLDYISRPTGLGMEHFFSANVFDLLRFK